MENVSKALFIAASVILGVLLLSVMIYMFRAGARVNETYDQKQITNQLELYNSRFEHYDRANNNIMDVISLANLAFDTNIDANYDPTHSIKVEVALGNSIFTIPNRFCQSCDNTYTYNWDKNELRYKCKKCGDYAFKDRNLILNPSKKPISIYKLAELDLLALKSYGFTGTGIKGKGSDATVQWTDTLAKTHLATDSTTSTIYKYLFEVEKPEDFEYHQSNMRVSRIKLTLYLNSEWMKEWD